MKGKSLNFLFGIVLGLSLAFAYGFAPGVIGKIKVHFLPVTFMIDGLETRLNSSKIFTYNDVLYVPLRFVSETLSKPITWDDAKQTIWIGQQPAGSYIYLKDLKVLRTQGDAWEVTDSWNKKEGGQALTIAGKKYQHGWYQRFWETNNKAREKEFLLNENYSHMEGFFGIDDYTINTSNKASCKIFADGKEVFNADNVKGGDDPIPFNIDLEGKKRLKFYVVTFGDSKDPLCVDFADVKLYFKSFNK